ncbi:hypothetical protein HK105_201853 [Polyrhizophydium stewartii]|uniref:Ankyrin repeat domain containing protein n=1 Tax=Polyrhizophydium stewartii TaxID=2732419 RepID=A0ABR4NFZ7_9FUNG
MDILWRRRSARRLERLERHAPLAPGSSEWDRLPAELRKMVLEHAGPLTRLVCGCVDDVEALPDADKQRMWADALELDWRGQLRRLPAVEPDASALEAVRSQRLAERVGFIHTSAAARAALESLAASRFWPAPRPALHHRHSKAVEAHSYAVLRSLMNGRAAPTQISAPAIVAAARFGMLDALRLMHDRLPAGQWSTEVMDAAAASGHLAVVRFLHEHRTEGCTPAAMDAAAEHGHTGIVSFLLGNRREGCTRAALVLAARNGHAEIVALLLERAPRADWDLAFVVGEAAWSRHAHVCRVLFDFCEARGIVVDDDDDGVDGRHHE